MGRDAADLGLDRMDGWRGPIGTFREQALHVYAGMDGPLADRAEAKACDGHASTGMVCSLSQLTVTAAPVSSTSPVWFWIKARSGISPRTLVWMR